MLPFPWEEGHLHLYRLGGKKVLFDVASSSLFSLDPAAAALFEAGRTNNLEESMEIARAQEGTAVDEALAELEGYHNREMLLTPDPASGLRPRPFPYLKALCLNLAHDCNLRCRYCFASSGAYRGDRRLMPRETALASLEMLLVESGPLPQVEVDFFGGEPLLNFHVLQEAVSYGKRRAAEMGKQIRFTLTTNALLLDEEIDAFLNREGMRVVLSIDGRPEDHDRLRTNPSGKGSQAQVLHKIEAFLQSRGKKDYFLRGTYTALTPDFLANTLYLHDLGYAEISMEPVVAECGDPLALGEEHLEQAARQYEQLVEEITRREEQGRPLHFFHFELDMSGLSCISKKLAGCGAGVEYLAVTPEGELYPCHQFVGREGFSMGTVERGILSPDLRRRFEQLSFLDKEDCPSCWARYLCSGGCHANAHLATGDMLRPDPLGCTLTRKRMECALSLKLLRKEHRNRSEVPSPVTA